MSHDDDRAARRPPLRAGYMGHITQLCNALVATIRRRPLVAQLLGGFHRWPAFVEETLVRINEVCSLKATLNMLSDFPRSGFEYSGAIQVLAAGSVWWPHIHRTAKRWCCSSLSELDIGASFVAPQQLSNMTSWEHPTCHYQNQAFYLPRPLYCGHLLPEFSDGHHRELQLYYINHLFCNLP